MARNHSVVHALAPAPVGGLESVVASLSAGCRDRGHEVAVAAVLEPGIERHAFAEEVSGRGVPFERLEVPPRAYHVEARRWKEVFDRRGPDVVHTHGYRGDVVAGSVARWFDLPVVSTVHGFTGGGWRNRIYEWLQRRALTRLDAVVAVSEPIRRRLSETGVEDGRLHLVRNAWRPGAPVLSRAEARRELGVPTDPLVAGWVGRLTPEKGPDVFVEAMARLDEPEAGITGSMVGTGGGRAALAAKAERLGLGDRIRFHGQVPGAARLYRAFDVFVLSSRTEGTPVVLFEAMAAGVPVVATRVGGVPDVVRDEREALLVPPGDPTAVARAVTRVLEDPEAADRRVERARRRLRTEFALEPWLDRYEEIYERVSRKP